MDDQDDTPENIVEAMQRALLARYEAERRACSTHERATRARTSQDGGSPEARPAALQP